MHLEMGRAVVFMPVSSKHGADVPWFAESHLVTSLGDVNSLVLFFL